MEMKNEWVKDPKIFNVNRLRATASIHRYASIKELKEKQSSFNYYIKLGRLEVFIMQQDLIN